MIIKRLIDIASLQRLREDQNFGATGGFLEVIHAFWMSLSWIPKGVLNYIHKIWLG